MIENIRNQILEALTQGLVIASSLMGEIPASVLEEIDTLLKTEGISEEERKEALETKDQLVENFKKVGDLTQQAMVYQAKISYKLYEAYQEAGFTKEEALQLTTHQKFSLDAS